MISKTMSAGLILAAAVGATAVPANGSHHDYDRHGPGLGHAKLDQYQQSRRLRLSSRV